MKTEFNLEVTRSWVANNPTVLNVGVNAYVAALDEIERLHEPVPMILTCPVCNARHIDEGVFATKPHHTHSCQSCGMNWRPAIVATCGVQFLPGFKNEVKP